jgi:ABC-type bacteriocin/lantibiotic exporter with double-glycine peptidase domain
MAEVASSAEDRAAVLRDPENLRAETAATLASVSAYTRAELDPSQPMIALEGVSYTYEGESEPVLRDARSQNQNELAATHREGDGCGKSTLLNLLNGSAPCE